jgi:hypothetical protein
MRTTLLITAAALLVPGLSAPAFGQSVPEQSASKKARDPNEIVCERQEEIGSRLGGQRVCKTRAQWAEERRAVREDVDKAQMQRDLNHPQ